MPEQDDGSLLRGEVGGHSMALRRLRTFFAAGALLTLALTPACGGADEPMDEFVSDEDGATAEVAEALTLTDTVTNPVGSVDGNFNVDTQGSAAYSIPIKVPPGLRGIEPKLALAYRSGGGNGIMGTGWVLNGLSAITRCARTPAQDGVRGGVNGDSNDRFCLDGRRLVATPSSTYGANGAEYRTEIETFSRIYSYGSCGTGPCRFEVTDKNGNLAVFGQTNAVAMLSDGSTPHQYALQKLKDANGNYLVVNYTVSNGQSYPQEIIYTKHDSAPGLKTRRIGFEYETRTDREFVYVAGTKVATNNRLARIKTYIGTASGEKLVRDYRLAYTMSGLTGRSLLNTVKECDALGVCLPATTFTYNSNAAGTDKFTMVNPNGTGLENYQGRMRYVPGAFLYPADINGDGKSDFLRVEHSGSNLNGWAASIAGNLSEYFSRGDGTFNPVELTGPDATNYIDGNHIEVYPFDYNGDGRTDFIRREKGVWSANDAVRTFAVYVTQSSGQGFNVYYPGSSVWTDVYQGWLGAEGGSKIFLGDFNGDGRGDFLRSQFATWVSNDPSNSFNVYFSTGNAGTFNVSTPTGSTYGTYLRSDYVDIIPGDYNGDGMTDFIRREKAEWNQDLIGSFSVYYSKGDGTFDTHYPGSSVVGDIYQDLLRTNVGTGSFAGVPPLAINISEIIPGDFNGDGKTDFIRHQAGKWTVTNSAENFSVYFSTGKNGTFERVIPAEPVPAPSPAYYGSYMNGEYTELTPIDYNGDGKTDFIRRERGLWAQNASDTFDVYISKGDGSFDRIRPGNQGSYYDFYQWGFTTENANLMTADVDGDGKSDLIRQEWGAVDDDVNTFQVFFANGDDAGDYLKDVQNGLGATVAVTYAPLTDTSVYSKGADATYPNITFQGSMYVVKSTQMGQVGQSATETYGYTYTNAVMNTQGRGFLGFAKVSQSGPTGNSEVEYHQDFPYTGNVKRRVTKGQTADYYVETTYTYDYVTPVSGAYAVRPTSEQMTQKEGVDASATYTSRKTFEYDNYGNVAIVHDLGSTLTTLDDVDTCTVWANDTTNWRLALPAYSRVADTCTYTNGSCSCTGLKYFLDRYYGGTPNVQETWELDDVNVSWIVTYFTYDVHGNQITKSLPGNGARIIESTTYDADYKTFPISQTRSSLTLSLTTNLEHDPRFGGVASQTDVNGKTVTHQFDGLGRQTAVWAESPAGLSVAVTKTSHGTDNTGNYRLTEHREAWTTDTWRTEREYLDGKGRVWRTESQSTNAATPVVILREYDAYDQIKKESMPFYQGSTAYYTTYSRDWLGRLSQVVDVNNMTTTITHGTNTAVCTGCAFYEQTNEPTGIASGRLWYRHFDGDNHVRRLTDPESRVTSYTYDKLGRKSTITDAAGTTTMQYDRLGRLISTTSPDRGTVVNQYDASTTWLQSTTQGDGQVTNYSYDALGRVTQKNVVGKQTINFTYDNAAVANGGGRLTNVSVVPSGQTTASSSNQFSYTAGGQIATNVITIDGTSYTVQSEYDPQGRLKNFTYPDSTVLARTFNAQGILSKLAIGTTEYANYDSFAASGQPTQLRYGNSTTTTLTYDNAARLATAKVTKTSSPNLMDYTYAWDSVHRITSLTDNRDSTRTQTFTYSNAGQLLTASGVYGSATYAYDSVGNIIAKEGNAYTYTGHRVTSGTNFTASYDGAGNRTGQTRNGVTWGYGYDGEGHLTVVTKNGTTVNQFAYDFSGERVKKVDANGTITHYVTANYEVVFMPDGRKLKTKYVNGPSGRVAAITTETAAGASVMPDIQTLNLMKDAFAKNTLAGRLAYLENRLQVLKLQPWAAPVALGTLALLIAAATIRLLRRVFPSAAGRWANAMRTVLLPEPTAYTRRHPVFAMALPLVMAAFLSACGQAPTPHEHTERIAAADEALTAGANGAGYPEVGTYYFHSNHLSSASVVTDASGTVKARVEYKPYGEIFAMANDGTDMFRSKFTGKEWDNDSELYYYHARHYDPVTGRFMTPDTELVGGSERETAAHNPYAYANNNPVTYTDPSGNIVFLIVVVAVVVGAYSGGMATNGTWDVTKWNWKSWKTYLGMAAGAAVGGLSGGVGASGLGVGGALVGSIMEAATINGLRLLAPQGYTMEQFGMGLALDITTGALAANYLPGLTTKAKGLWNKLWKTTADATSKPGVMGVVGKGLFKASRRMGTNEASRQLNLTTTTASAPRTIEPPTSSRADGSVVGDYLRGVTDSVLTSSGADDVKGRVSSDWSVTSDRSNSALRPTSTAN